MLRRLERYRAVVERFSSKWSTSVIIFLHKKPQKFNKLKLLFEPISAKVLSETLDRLESLDLIYKDAHGKYHCTHAGTKLARQLLQLMETLEEIF